MTVLDRAPARTSPGATARRAALSQLNDAVEFLGLDSGMHEMLATPRRSLTVAVPLRREDGSSTVLTGYRVQHNLARGPAKGGIRFHPDVDARRDRRALAAGMTWKCRGRRPALRRRQGRGAVRSPAADASASSSG